MILVLLLSQVLVLASPSLPPGFHAQTLCEKLNSPTAMAMAPDGRIFICQQGGEVRVLKNGGLVSYPFVQVPTRVKDEQGLTGIALDPGFPENGHVYLSFTENAPPFRFRIVRYTAVGDAAAAGSDSLIFTLDAPKVPYHQGGAIFFGKDGFLYIATGEAGFRDGVKSLGNLHGKILRIRKDGSIPGDNPFFREAQGANRAIWALGFRSPFTGAVQSETGRIFVLDVGGDQFEEIDEIKRGGDYGWPGTEGLAGLTPPRLPPLYSYSHGPNAGQGNSICGGVFYPAAGGGFPPSYSGRFLFADYTHGWIRSLDPQGKDTVVDFAEHLSAPIDLEVGPDGSLYCLQRGRITMDGGSGPGWDVGSLLRISHGLPEFITQPEGYAASVGESVAFRAAAAGEPPLDFQWQRQGKGSSGFRDLPGAAGPELMLAKVGMPDNGSAYRCRVRNGSGEAFSQAASLSVTRNRRPEAVIEAPGPDYRYKAGTTLSFRGRGTDPEGGPLPPGALSWWVDYHSDHHFHPYILPRAFSGQDSFHLTDTGEFSDEDFYRIHLKATDRSGLSRVSHVDILPLKVSMTISSIPSGLSIELNDQEVVTPYAMVSIVGMKWSVKAPSLQKCGGDWLTFKGWSNGGDQQQTLTANAGGVDMTARFEPKPLWQKVINLIKQWTAKVRAFLGL